MFSKHFFHIFCLDVANIISFLRHNLNIKMYPIMYAEWSRLNVNFLSNPLENYSLKCSEL